MRQKLCVLSRLFTEHKQRTSLYQQAVQHCMHSIVRHVSSPLTSEARWASRSVLPMSLDAKISLQWVALQTDRFSLFQQDQRSNFTTTSLALAPEAQHITWIVALVPTDAHRIDAFGTDHFADLCGQTIHVSGYAAPADVVECYLVEFTVATWECNRRAYNQVVCRLQRRFSTPICRLIGRLCSTTREEFHGCISMHFKHTTETRAWQDCTDKYDQ